MVTGSKGRFILSNVHMLDHSFANAPWQTIHLDLPMSRRASSDCTSQPPFFFFASGSPSAFETVSTPAHEREVSHYKCSGFRRFRHLNLPPRTSTTAPARIVCRNCTIFIPVFTHESPLLAGISTPAPRLCVCAFVSRPAAARYQQMPSSRRWRGH